ncbi:hypothetical protein XENOCAPTIV_028879 [Xenoophorus captivus]|uniref:Uncharacterized protein n=1 Tax=Xenoophorus captivus TaxID=1517983 RepID=A0ABV0S135_9TELE
MMKATALCLLIMEMTRVTNVAWPLSQEMEEEEDTQQTQQESVLNLSSSPSEDADNAAALKDTTESLRTIPEMQDPNLEVFSSGDLLEQEMVEPDMSGS